MESPHLRKVNVLCVSVLKPWCHTAATQKKGPERLAPALIGFTFAGGTW